MRFKMCQLFWSLIASLCTMTYAGLAQDTAAVATEATTSTANAGVPHLINYPGVLKDINGKPLTGITGVTFLLYKEEQGGSPIWMETQNITADKNGKYTVTLGSTKLDASLSDSFANGEARWLAVRISGQDEQPRVLLVSVPYAIKAGDAETVGGLPPSAFVLANGARQGAPGSAAVGTIVSPAWSKTPAPANATVTGKGIVNFIPMWDTTSDIVNSVMFQKSTQVGIGTTSPTATLDVNGKDNVRDTLTLFPKNADNTLAVSGTAFNISSTGAVTFIPGQKFPGTGTITGVKAGTDLTGGGTSGTVTLNLNVGALDARYAQLAAANTFANNQKIVVNNSSPGLSASQSGSGDGVDATSTGGTGVFGISNLDAVFATAVLGQELGGTQATIGVEGYSKSPLGVGTVGQAVTASIQGANHIGINPVGLWGDGGAANTFAVLGTVDDGSAFVGHNLSLSTTLFAENDESQSSTAPVLHTVGGAFGGHCDIDVSGNLTCTGSKSAVVSVDNDSRKVALYAVEAPENWFEDAGSGQLVNGSATISLEHTFVQTVNTLVDYHVFLTPNGDCKGLYVSHKSRTSFEVHELVGGTSNIAFDYRIMAKRRGYETIRLADKTQQFTHSPLVRPAGERHHTNSHEYRTTAQR